MKLLVVCQYYYPERFRVNDICTQLAEEGHEVTVLTGLPNYPSGIVDKNYKGLRNRNQNINGVNVKRSWLLGRGKGTKGLIANYVSFAISSTLRSLFVKKDFDAIMVYQLSPVTMAIPGIVLKKLTGKPLIIYCHDLWPESIASAGIRQGQLIYQMLFKLSQWIYRSADSIFTSSHMFEQYFQEKFGIFKNITHLPVYAESLFENVDDANKTDEINLVFAGNIGEMQSVETIIYAANEIKHHKDIKFHIVGEGSSRQKCEDLTKSLALNNVIFHGQFPLEAMPKFYGMADAMLITLKANKFISFTLPNKVQSYLAAGKPIIGAIDGETSLVIRESNCGLCAPAEDYKLLAENIVSFAQNRSEHITYGHNAKKYYEDHFSKPVYFTKLYSHLQKIIDKDVR